MIAARPITLNSAGRASFCAYIEADSCGGTGNTFAIAGSRVRELGGMANLWVDIPLRKAVTPYLGGGLGVAGFEIDGEGKARFAWQLGAGASLGLSDSIDLTLDYRHREIGRTAIAWDATSGLRMGKIRTDAFTAGVRFRF